MIEKKPEHFPERPLECSECKKPIAVRYTEIIGNMITHTSMCGDCPELQRRLYGTKASKHVYNQLEGDTDLCCGNCGTQLEEVKRGHRLGCMECYNVFGELLLMELLAANKLSPRVSSLKKSVPIHIGRTPGENLGMSPSSRLLALNEALRETLSREDYEQAAWLRDQIKALTEKEEQTETEQEDGETKNEQ
jgi:protein arginine kinase activator